jgi:hypothetical protein
MRTFTSRAVVAAVAVAIPVLAVSPALAAGSVPASGHTKHRPMTISFASGLDSSAHWVSKQRAVLFSVGAGSSGGDTATSSGRGTATSSGRGTATSGGRGTATSGGGSTAASGGRGTATPEFAEIVVHHAPAAPPATEPGFTVSGTGAPVLDIGFADGGYLQCATGGGGTAWTAYDAAGAVLVSGTSYAAALAAEQGTGPSLTVRGVILRDAQVPQGAAYTDTVTALQYNGVSLVPRTHHHGGTRPSGTR